MYPVNIDLKGKSCLVVGGGHVALRKIGTLLEEAAEVTVIAPELSREVKALADEGTIHWRKEIYKSGDAADYFLVITCAGDREVAEAVHEEAEARGFLYNAADFPKLGNCHIPARFTAEGLMVTVSTGGRSPALAKYFKNRFKNEIPPGFSAWMDRVEVIRGEMKECLEGGAARENFWREVLNDRVMDLVGQGKIDEAEECVRHGIGRFRA